MSVRTYAGAFFVVGVLVPLLYASPAAAEIYKWFDAQGNVHFQDRPPEGVKSADVEVRESSPVPARLPASAGSGPAGPVAPPAPRSRAEVEVELYSTAWCPWCQKAREYFVSAGVKLTDYDIEKDAEAAARKRRLDPQQGVPFAVVNGVRIHGYAPDAYLRALDAPPPAPAGP